MPARTSPGCAAWGRRLAAVLLALGLAVTLAACATPPRCQTLTQCLAVAQITVTETRTLAADLLARGAITVATAQRVQTLADEARAELTTARTLLGAGDHAGAEATLRLVETILLRAEAALKERVQ